MRRLLTILALAVPAARALPAQAPSDSGTSIIGFGLEMVWSAEFEPTSYAFTVRNTELKPGDAAMEFAFTGFAVETFPILMPEFGVAWSSTQQSPRLLVRAGVSTVWFALPGVYAGASMIVGRGESRLRLDATWRQIITVENKGGFNVVTVGVAVAFNSRGTPCAC